MSSPPVVVNVDVGGGVRHADRVTTAARRARLLAALGFLEIRWRGLKPDAAGALERWLNSWPGLGDIIVGVQAQGASTRIIRVAPRSDLLEDAAMTASLRSRVAGAVLAGVVVILMSLLAPANRADAVEPGQPAPDFKLPSTLGNDIALSEFRGKKWVLLEFYSADFAPS